MFKAGKIYLVPLMNIKMWMCLCAIDFTIGFTATGKFLQKYFFDDVGYLKWLMIAMFIDLITGILKAAIVGGIQSVSSSGLRATISKCVQYGAFLIITHILTHFEIGGQVQNANFLWINKLACEFLILIETKSIYENLTKINPKMDFMKIVFEKLLKMFKEDQK